VTLVPKVKRIKRADYELVAEYLEKSTDGAFVKALWIDRFELWWDKNSTPEIGHEPNAWVLEVESVIVGFFCYVSVNYLLEGENITGHSASSWYVDLEYRKYSIELLRPFLNAEKPCLLLNTTPSKDKAIKIFNHFNLQPLYLNWLNTQLILPIDISSIVDFLIARWCKQKTTVQILTFIKYLISPLIFLIKKTYQLRLSSPSKDYSAQEIDHFSNEYDHVWNSFKKDYNFLMIRDSKSLNWLFFGSKELQNSRKIIEIRWKEDLLGYVALNIVKHKSAAKEIYSYHIIDSILIDDRIETYKFVLKSIVKIGKQEKIKISIIVVSPFDPLFKKYWSRVAFVTKTNKQNILYKFPDNTYSSINDLSDNNGWYATPLDGDRGFFIGA
jgi:hypothetical protein